MRRLQLTIWVAFVDVLMVCLMVLINQANPKASEQGVKINAEYLITAEWDVKIDADVDLHTIVPDGHEGTDVYYSARQFSNVTLDQDNRGFIDAVTMLPDGSTVTALTDKETTTIRGKVPGHFDVGVHLFRMSLNGKPLSHNQDGNVKVHVEVIQLNPTNKIVFQGDVTLNRVEQCINVVSFDLDRDANYTAADVPLEPVTNHVFDEHGSIRTSGTMGQPAAAPQPTGGQP